MSSFIKDLIDINPDAAYEKRDRWLIIAKAYVEANPGQTCKQIWIGMGLSKNSSAASSCYYALRRLVRAGKLARETNPLLRSYTYWPKGQAVRVQQVAKIVESASRSNVTICGTLPKNWNTVTPYTRS